MARTLRKQSGLALVLVLTVIMALAVIATPFVLSMIQQEKTATVERAFRQAYYGAEGVRNYALAQMFSGTDGLERHAPMPGFDTWSRDTRNEFDLELREARLKDLNILDPKGRIWGVTVQDEQGKINTMSAPDQVLNNLRRLIDPRIVDVKDYTTIYSGRTSHWGYPQKIRAVGTFTNQAGSMDGAQVDNVFHLGVGAKLRVSKPGMAAIEVDVVQNGKYPFGFDVIRTSPGISGSYTNGIVELEMRHPVNMNTAKREAVAALYEELTLTWPPGPQGTRSYTLTRQDAKEVADLLAGQTMDTFANFTQVILGLGIDDLGKAAIILNALDPTNVLLTNGSMPFCFTANETVTIQARSTVNMPVGTPISGTGFREVVDIAPPTTLTRHFENQYDFDRLMGPPRLVVTSIPVTVPQDTGTSLALGGYPGAFNGFPYGSRLMSFPTALLAGEQSDMTLKPQPAGTENYVSMRTVHDRRGQGSFLFTVEHFDADLDGRKLVNEVYQVPWNAAFTRMPNNPAAVPPLQQMPDVAAGGMEFWLKFDTAVPANVELIDIREGDTMNRITVELVDTEIIYRITDATMGLTNNNMLRGDKGFSEIRAPHNFKRDTWYHIAAYWKGTRYGHMLLLIDGFVPFKAKWNLVEDEGNQICSTELSSTMPIPPDPNNPFTAVPMKDSSFTAKPQSYPLTDPNFTVPLLVGGEVIEYDPATGQGLRGARGTPWQDHPKDAKVCLFGFASRVRQLSVTIDFGPPDPPIVCAVSDLPSTKGKTLQMFGPAQGDVNNANQDVDTDGAADDVSAATNVIIFNSMDVLQWPQPGYIRIENEAIYYETITVLTPTTGSFNNCQRGQATSVPADHLNNRPIELWSVAVDVAETNVPTPALVQFNDEWFGPAQQIQNPTVPGTTFFWIGCTSGPGNAKPLLRGIATNGSQLHNPGERLCPTFGVRESDPTIFRWNVNRGDYITLVDANNRKEQNRVWNWMVEPQPPPPGSFPIITFSDVSMQLTALRAPVSQDFVRDDLHTRVLKWPSGELIDARWLELATPTANVEIGPITGTMDELKQFASAKGNFRTIATVDLNSNAVIIPSVGALGVGPQNPAGAVLCGEEVIGYSGYQGTQQLDKCQRGWLNSTTAVHDAGDLMFSLTFLPVSALSNPSTGETPLIQVKQRMAGQGYTAGYVLIDKEVIGFEKFLQNPATAIWEMDSLATFQGRGLFRGMFGTQEIAHATNAMVYGIPFRYWDGYKPFQFDNKTAYFQVAQTTHGAKWGQIWYDYDISLNDPLVAVHSYVRADGLGDFWQPGFGETSQVWKFTKLGWSSLDNFTSSRRDNGQIEARFFVEYKIGAYWPNDAWKRTMRLKEVKIEYTRETKVLLHEE